MYRLTNIPHHRDRCQLDVRVKDSTVRVVSIDPKDQHDKPDNWLGVGDLYIGDHMFEPDMRDDLRKMVGRALVFAIEHARDVGYRQAQSDIRDALGISRI